MGRRINITFKEFILKISTIKIAFVLSIAGLTFGANVCEAVEALVRSPGGFMWIDVAPLKFTIDRVEYHSIAECEKKKSKAVCEAAAKKALMSKAAKSATKPNIKPNIP